MSLSWDRSIWYVYGSAARIDRGPPMFEDPRGLVPQIIDRVELPASAKLAPQKPDAVLNLEQLRALDSNFVPTDENRTVAGLLGVWTGSVLLADLAEEHFHVPPTEPEVDVTNNDDDDEEE